MSLKNKILKLIFLIGIFYVLISFRGKVDATALSISVSTSSANVGESINVTISSSYTGRVNLSSSEGTLSDSKVWVEGNSQTVTLKSNSAGTIKITATAEGGTLSNNGQDVDISAQSATVTFKEKEEKATNNGSETTNTNKNNSSKTTKSSNANLKNLGITPNDFKGFKSSTTAYNVTVPNNVEQVTVYATLQDSKASLTGTGVQKLNVGKNTLNVVVTAEDGTKKTYTINVTREEENAFTTENNTTPQENSDDETSDEENVNSSNADLIKLEINGYTLTPEFSPDIYEYTLSINGDISNLDVIAEGANHNVSVEVVGNTDLVDGENIITVLVYNEETKENSTYQIIVNKTNIDLEGLNTTLNDAVKKANKIRYILLGILIFMIICIITFIVARNKYKEKNLNDNIYEYDEEDKERINLDEEEDFFSRVNKESIKEPEEEKVSTTSIANSIAQDTQRDGNISDVVVGNDEEQELESEDELFRKSKSKKKGKHF